MKEDKRIKELQDDPLSILNTNSAKMAEEKTEEAASAKPKMKGIVAVALAILVLVVIFIVGGVISEMQYQAQLAREAAQALREGDQVKYLEAPELVEGELEMGVTSLYYSEEDGMWVTVTFVNGQDAEVAINSFDLSIKNEEDKRIASGGNIKIKDLTVPAGETKEAKVYLEPEVVVIADDPLEVIIPVIEVDHSEVG